MAECLCLKNVTFYEQSVLPHQNDTHNNLFVIGLILTKLYSWLVWMNSRNVIGSLSGKRALLWTLLRIWRCDLFPRCGGRQLKRQTLCLKMKSMMKCRHVSNVLLLTVVQWLCLATAFPFWHGNIAWAPVDSYSDTVGYTLPYTPRQCFIVNPHEFLKCASGQKLSHQKATPCNSTVVFLDVDLLFLKEKFTVLCSLTKRQCARFKDYIRNLD